MASNDFTVPTPTEDESNTYYGLWDLLPETAKTSPNGRLAQSLYGTDTSKAIALLFEMARHDRWNRREEWTMNYLRRVASLPRAGEHLHRSEVLLDDLIQEARREVGLPLRKGE